MDRFAASIHIRFISTIFNILTEFVYLFLHLAGTSKAVVIKSEVAVAKGRNANDGTPSVSAANTDAAGGTPVSSKEVTTSDQGMGEKDGSNGAPSAIEVKNLKPFTFSRSDLDRVAGILSTSDCEPADLNW